MNPNLQYAQAIHGRFTGRGTGIIDTLHLVEVARAAGQIDLAPGDLAGVKKWFAEYAEWMTTQPYGIDERDAKNNHGTCWVTQVAAFARLTGDRGTDGLLPQPLQDRADSEPGGRRRQLPARSCGAPSRTAIRCSTWTPWRSWCRRSPRPQDNLWKWQLPDGRGMARAMAYMYPFLLDKKKWPLPPDVMYDKEWPVRQPCLLFAGLALDKPEYLALWGKLNPDPTVEEVLRNFPVRQPPVGVAAAGPSHPIRRVVFQFLRLTQLVHHHERVHAGLARWLF